MARKGRAGPALAIAAWGSFIAGTLGVAGVMVLAPALTKAALLFGPPEYFSLMVMCMMIVVYLVKGSMIKGLIMVGIGFLLCTIGLDPMTGRERFVYGVRVLRDGIGLIPVVIGMFGVTEVLETIVFPVEREVLKTKIKGYWPSRQDWKDSSGPMARGTLIGFLMGIFPGITPTIPTFLSYGVEKRLSRHPELFGTGVIEGVAAPEACNNAAATSSLVPLLSLGIPSSPFNAVLLGALMIYGLPVGPLLIKSNPNFFWGVLSSMYIGNIMLLVLNLPLIPLWVQVLRVPYTLLSTIILIFCFLGVYSINNSITEVYIMFLMGVFGCFVRQFGFEAIPLILAFVLGPLIEGTFRQSMVFSDGSLIIFITRPYSAFFILVALGILVTALVKKRRFVEKLGSQE
jgi:putative tricarboxylic transport membrane protein